MKSTGTYYAPEAGTFTGFIRKLQRPAAFRAPRVRRRRAFVGDPWQEVVEEKKARRNSIYWLGFVFGWLKGFLKGARSSASL